MKCVNCSLEVSANFIYCLQNNLCPSCGKEIMNEETVGLLKELKEAMVKMPNDPEGLAGWLISNYNLQKIGSGEPTEFYRPNSNKMKKAKPQIKVRKATEKEEYLEEVSEDIEDLEDSEETADGSELVETADDERTSLFFKKAGLSKDKIRSLKDASFKIKKNKPGIITNPFELEGEMNNPDEEDYDAEMGAGNDLGYDSEHSSVIAAQTAMKGQNKDNFMLNNLLSKSRGASQELANGGSVGKIRRL